ncbi:hypothetical protein L1049_005281 [Liquidambar formosana]|uniref:Uncharacterized protein n=1 Tax=Liquidambar formosana TaxID=63359 RepID=A0AAP0RV40_LIQFO
MAGRSHDLSSQAGEITGQAQTGEQVKNMAQGAADAVKHTLGMDTDNSKNPNLSSNNPNYSSNSNSNNPNLSSNNPNYSSNTNNPNYRSNTNNPSHPSL